MEFSPGDPGPVFCKGRILPQQLCRYALSPLIRELLPDLIAHLIAVLTDPGADGGIKIYRIASEFLPHAFDGDCRDPSKRPPPSCMDQPDRPSHRVRQVHRRTVSSERGQHHIRQIRDDPVDAPSALRLVLTQDRTQILWPHRIDPVRVHLVRHAFPFDGGAQLLCQPVPAVKDHRSGFTDIFVFHDYDPQSFPASILRRVIRDIPRGIQVGHSQPVQQIYRQIGDPVGMDIEYPVVI